MGQMFYVLLNNIQGQDCRRCKLQPKQVLVDGVKFAHWPRKKILVQNLNETPPISFQFENTLPMKML